MSLNPVIEEHFAARGREIREELWGFYSLVDDCEQRSGENLWAARMELSDALDGLDKFIARYTK